MKSLCENSDSNSILGPENGNYYDERIVNYSFDENSLDFNQNLNNQLNANYFFQLELNNSFEEENYYNENNFINIHNEEENIIPNQDIIPIYNIASNINNVQNGLNS